MLEFIKRMAGRVLPRGTRGPGDIATEDDFVQARNVAGLVGHVCPCCGRPLKNHRYAMVASAVEGGASARELSTAIEDRRWRDVCSHSEWLGEEDNHMVSMFVCAVPDSVCVIVWRDPFEIAADMTLINEPICVTSSEAQSLIRAQTESESP